jgi:hypothetical protein
VFNFVEGVAVCYAPPAVMHDAVYETTFDEINSTSKKDLALK